MTEHTIRTTVNEADQIYGNTKAFIFRDANIRTRIGDVLRFQVYSQGKPRMHKIGGRRYEVSYVSETQPIEIGFQVIGFREK